MWYLYILLVIIQCFSVGLIFYACCKIKQEKLVIIVALSSLPAFFWAFYNPLYTQGVQTELSYRSIDANDGTNWANSFVFTPSHVYTPENVEDVQHIVLNSSKVRVVGGGHSWVPLIETDGSLISMDKFKSIETVGDNVVVGAGVSIQDLTTYLEEKQKMIRGFGSVKKQSIGGAFSTSLHGDMPDGFSKHVVSLKAVNGLGNIVNTTNMRIWRDSVGVLGVIYEFTIKTFDLEYGNVVITESTFEEIMHMMHGAVYFDAVTISSGTLDFDKILFKARSVHVINKTEEHEVQHIGDQPRTVYFLFDYFVLPQFVLFSNMMQWFDLTFLFIQEQNITNVKVTNAWKHPPEYGFHHSEYAIPIENCSKAFEEMYEHLPKPSAFEFRYLNGDSDCCMCWSPHDSCELGLSILNLGIPNVNEAYYDAERIAYKYGGIAHLGKHFVGPLDNQTSRLPCFDEFNTTREAMDPHGKFVNKFTNEMIYGSSVFDVKRYTNKHHRLVLFRIIVILSNAGILFYCLHKPDESSRRKRKGYTRLTSRRDN